ncbi:MAG: alpha-galactosidase [Anaerolineales bacterium]
MKSIQIDPNWLKQSPPEQILTASSLTLNLPAKPIEFYRHGWQSWSLTAWLPADFKLPVQKPEILHSLQIDPLYAKHPAPNGSWVGAVRLDGDNTLLLGALGLDAHVALHGNELHGWYENQHGEWFVGYGEENTVFKRYAELLGERLGKAPGKPNPRVWCSWYSLYTAIDEVLLYRTFDEIGELSFDVLQVDDGWQVSISDWEANEKFPSGMQALAEKIKSTGRQAGLWLAPLIAVKSSRLFREHPDWFLKDPGGNFVSAGFNWGEQLYAIDSTHPEALAWLAALMKQVRAWGFDYLKLDFLYAGALPGKRHTEMSREAAYRQGIQVMREAMGEDVYFLTCGAPIMPSIGLCDAIRVGPDVARAWESYRDAMLLYNPATPGTKNAIRTSINRLWLKPLVATDPDVVYFRSQHTSMSEAQKQMLQDLALVCDFKATSDLPAWLNPDERAKLQKFLEQTPNIQQVDRYAYKLDDRLVDFTPVMPLPKIPRGFDAFASLILGQISNQPWALKLLNALGKYALRKAKRELLNDLK